MVVVLTIGCRVRKARVECCDLVLDGISRLSVQSIEDVSSRDRDACSGRESASTTTTSWSGTTWLQEPTIIIQLEASTSDHVCG